MSVTGVDPPGIETASVGRWLRSIDPTVETLSATMIAGGRSNLTFLVNDSAGRTFVLRRPPLGSVLATAHDVGREYRILKALAPTPVPVPPVVGFCENEEVIGAPFYVMGFVPGLVLSTRAEASEFATSRRRPLSLHLVDVLGVVHGVVPDHVGLGELGRTEGYLDRQLRRWHSQYEQSRTEELPVLEEVHRRLLAQQPPQRYTGLVHGDFRLGNMIVAEDGTISAVLDWELCTLGDQLADLGWLVSSWVEAGEDSSSAFPPASSAPGFATRRELVDRYAASTGRDVSDLPYYVAFSYWRSACIGTGVLNRYRRDAMGAIDFDIDQHARSIRDTADRARDALDELA